MKSNTDRNKKASKPGTIKNVLLCLGLLISGVIVMRLFILNKQPPVEVERGEVPLQVEVTSVEPKDYPVFITGYGEAGALNVVPISPEVNGKIINVHPRLEDGEVIPAGDLLFKIDPRNYNIISKTGRERLQFLERNRDLAEKEFIRIRTLFKKNRVGTVSGVEAAEKAYLSAADVASQVSQAVESAEINLERCDVRTQFRGRLKGVSLERGQYVSPGKRVLTLVDDSTLEVLVPIDSRDARKWLLFDKSPGNITNDWFTAIKKVPCEIRWTENIDGKASKGVLHRVVAFDKNTRTITLAIRVYRNNSGFPEEEALPLVDGMFCSVTIPGKTMTNVIRLPRWAVSIDESVYAVVNNRLKTVPVDVVRTEGDYAYVAGGISKGDTVIVTRLVDPLEKSLLAIVNRNKTKG